MLNMRNFRIGSRLIATTVGALSLMIAFVVVALISLGIDRREGADHRR